MSHASWYHRQPTLLPGRPVPAANLYRFRAVAGGFFMWMTFGMYALYVVRDAGLTPFQLLVAGMVLEASVVVFEIPTGILSDAVSRRLSIIIGTVITGLGWAVMGLSPTFEGILLGEFLWGFGFTFMSGTIEAWLSDEVGEDEAARIYPQAAQWRQGAVVAGVLASALLGLIDLRWPFIIGGAGQIGLAVVYACTMTEAGWKPATLSGGSRLAGMRRIAVDAFIEGRRHPIIRAAVGVALLFGASSEVFGRLWNYHLFEHIGIPSQVDEVVLFGGIALASQLGALGVIAIGRRVTADGSRTSTVRVLSTLYVASVVAPLAFAFVPEPGIAIALVVVAQWAGTAESSFFTMWVNRGLDPRTRATVLSGVGQANSFGQVVATLIFAVIAASAGVSFALALGALVLLPAVALVRTRPPDEREDVRAEGVAAAETEVKTRSS